MINAMRNYFKDESAAAAIEYGLVVGLVSIALIAAMVQVGLRFNETLAYVTNAITKVLDRINGTQS